MTSIILASLLISKPVHLGATYYASPTGLTTNDGSYGSPFPISKATSLAAGDTLYLKAGDYTLSGPLYPHAGNSTARVTIAKDPLAAADSVTIICGYTGNYDMVALGSYTNWDGIDLKNSTMANLSTWGASHVTLSNVKSSGAKRSGILVGQGTRGGNPGGAGGIEDLPGSTDIQVSYCTVTDCVRVNSNRNAGNWPPALFVFQANNVSVDHCTVTQCYGEGIDMRTVAESSITNCTVTDAYSASFYLDNSAHITLTGNTAYASDSNYYRSSHAAIGFLMAVEGPPSEAQLGVKYVTESSNSFSGCPGREFYRYYWDTFSDCQDSSGTCSFSSTPVGLMGFPATQYIIQPNP